MLKPWGSDEKKGDGGSRDRRGVAVRRIAGSAGDTPRDLGEGDCVTRRRLGLVKMVLGVREGGCGADDCLTGELLRRRLTEAAVVGSMRDAEAVRLRRNPGR